MKPLLPLLVLLIICQLLLAQVTPGRLEEIPVFPGLKENKVPEGEENFFDTPYRVELSREMINVANAGKYSNYARVETRVRAFEQTEHADDFQQKMFEFYMDKLNARPVGAEKSDQVKTEPDLKQLKQGEATPVLFYVALAGGMFKWFVYDGDIKILTVTFGSTLLFVETTFRKDIPVIVPLESEMGFPVYPGAEFRPLLSGFVRIPESTEYRQMIFHSNDPVDQVYAFFEKRLPQKAEISETRTRFTFHEKINGPDPYLKKTLEISQIVEVAPEGTTQKTEIRYYYPFI